MLTRNRSLRNRYHVAAETGWPSLRIVQITAELGLANITFSASVSFVDDIATIMGRLVHGSGEGVTVLNRFR